MFLITISSSLLFTCWLDTHSTFPLMIWNTLILRDRDGGTSFIKYIQTRWLQRLYILFISIPLFYAFNIILFVAVLHFLLSYADFSYILPFFKLANCMPPWPKDPLYNTFYLYIHILSTLIMKKINQCVQIWIIWFRNCKFHECQFDHYNIL